MTRMSASMTRLLGPPGRFAPPPFVRTNTGLNSQISNAGTNSQPSVIISPESIEKPAEEAVGSRRRGVRTFRVQLSRKETANGIGTALLDKIAIFLCLTQSAIPPNVRLSPTRPAVRARREPTLAN